jgi:hypothetical protein
MKRPPRKGEFESTKQEHLSLASMTWKSIKYYVWEAVQWRISLSKN